MNYGLGSLKDLPLSLRLLREIHAELLRGVRGGERTPGEFRKSQNWVGKRNSMIKDAEFVPPPPHEMHAALHNLEGFLHDRPSLPVLVQCGLAHAQFETIHPFLDGTGRIGRLLITLLLCERQVLERPLLYLSYFLKAHRSQYYDRLMAVRNDGDWEGWLKFFLRGVYEVSRAATETARAILELREGYRDTIAQRRAGSTSGLRLLDYLFQHPLISVRMAENELNCAYVTAGTIIQEFEAGGILQEVTDRQRNRLYRFQPYLNLFDRQALAIARDEGASEDRMTVSNGTE
jgi:Fic family protein